MKNNSFAHGQELPLGLSMALAQVPAAYAYFASKTADNRLGTLYSLQRGNAWSSQQLVKRSDH